MMTLEGVLLAVQAIAHFITFAFIVTWRPTQHTVVRSWVSLLAAILAGSSFAMVVQIITDWDRLLITGPLEWSTVRALIFLLIVWQANGNIAALLPRQNWNLTK